MAETPTMEGGWENPVKRLLREGKPALGITITVNSVTEMTPRSSPMFRMISSMSPRAFMSEPIPKASRQDSPARRPAWTFFHCVCPRVGGLEGGPR